MTKPTDSSPGPELMTTEEVAQLLRTPIRTVRDWAYRRVGPPSLKVGSRRLYDRREVLSWLDAQKASA